jgi:chromosome segregation ATPase
MKKNTVLRVIRIALATMITATTVTVNVRAMDGEVFENTENNQEDTYEEVYNEAVSEAVEAETAAEESVEEAVEISAETVEAIAEGNEEEGIEAADVTDGGAVAQESVEAFVEAVESLPVEENLNEAVAELNEVTEELVKVDEADRAADESAEETVANVAEAKEVANSIVETVAETKEQANGLIDIISSEDADAEQVSEAMDKLDQITEDAKESVETKKATFEALCDKFEIAKRKLEGAQKVYEETVKNLKSSDSSVNRAAEKLEEAKKNVEVLSEACDNAKENLEKEQAAVEEILAKKEISDKNKDWKTQDKLMESIISGYIIPNFIDKDATNIKYTEMLRGFDRQNSSYTVVTYLDKDNNTVKRYFNIDRTDRQFKENDQWYRLGSSREIVVYEKPEEDITSSVYQKNHFGNFSVTNQFKADVNSGKYDVYSFDYADGTNEFKCIDELEVGVESGEIEFVDGVYYMNGTAARKIVQTTSGNAKGIRISTKDDAGLKAFIENASKLVEKYEKYGEIIADTQDKVEEASDKVEALKDAIDNIEENRVRISADLVADLTDYLSEEDMTRVLNAGSTQKAVQILESILAGAKEDLDNAAAELDELIEKRDEIKESLSVSEEIVLVENAAEEAVIEELAEVVETKAPDVEEVIAAEEAVEAVANTEVPAVAAVPVAVSNNVEQNIEGRRYETETVAEEVIAENPVEVVLATLAEIFENTVAPVATAITAQRNTANENVSENTVRVTAGEAAGEAQQITEEANIAPVDMLGQILGAKRYNKYNKEFEEFTNKLVGLENSEAAFAGIGATKNIKALAEMDTESGIKINWLWLLIIAILLITEKKIRDERQKKAQELKAA